MSDPIQGSDVSITVMGPNGPELAGEYQEVDIEVENDVEEYLETNERIARLLDGVVKISGKLKRGWIDVDIIGRVFGYTALRRGEKIGAQPRFTITCTVNNSDKGLSGAVKLEQAVLPKLSLAIKAGKGVVDKDLTYRAEGISQA